MRARETDRTAVRTCRRRLRGRRPLQERHAGPHQGADGAAGGGAQRGLQLGRARRQGQGPRPLRADREADQAARVGRRPAGLLVHDVQADGAPDAQAAAVRARRRRLHADAARAEAGRERAARVPHVHGALPGDPPRVDDHRPHALPVGLHRPARLLLPVRRPRPDHHPRHARAAARQGLCVQLDAALAAAALDAARGGHSRRLLHRPGRARELADRHP